MTTPALRHLPFAWAWPRRAISQLLQAAAHARGEAAQRAWKSWAHGKNLDDVRFEEMRLLAAVAPRLQVLDPTHDERQRITGIERMLWSRSHVVLRQIQPALEALHGAGIEIMVLKGAARVARDAAALRLRFVNDVDVLVRPEQFRRAFDLLDASGWRSTERGTAHFQRTLLDSIHGVNLIQGDVADLDLHRSAFHLPQQSLADDAAMWSRSAAGALGPCPVRVPSATDTIVLALAHGGHGGQRSSDWLLDVVDAIASGNVDWLLLQDVVSRRGLDVPAAVTLTYLATALECPIPGDALQAIAGRARRRPLTLASGLVLCRPKHSLSPPLRVARIAAKSWQALGAPVERRPKPTGRVRTIRLAGAEHASTAATTTHEIKIQPATGTRRDGWQGTVAVTVEVPALARSRRIDFEFNAAQEHLARLSYRPWRANGRPLMLKLQAQVSLPAGESNLLVQSAPGRGLRPGAPRKHVELFAPLAFRVLGVECRQRAA